MNFDSEEYTLYRESQITWDLEDDLRTLTDILDRIKVLQIKQMCEKLVDAEWI